MAEYYWQINDGRIWSSIAAKWITADDVPVGQYITPLSVNGIPAGEDYLIRCIDFYGCDPGELTPKGGVSSK